MIKQAREAAAESMGPDHNPVIVAQLTHSGRYSKPNGIAEPLIPERDPYRDPLIRKLSLQQHVQAIFRVSIQS